MVAKQQSTKVLVSAKAKMRRAALKIKIASAFTKAKFLRLKTVKEARPVMEDATKNLTAGQVQDIQKIVDDSIDWLRIYMQL